MPAKKRRKLKIGNLLILIIGCLAVCALLFFGIKALFNRGGKDTAKPDPTPETTAEPTPEPTPTPDPAVQKLTLFVSGDGILHESVYEDAKNADGTFDFAKMLDEVLAVAEPYDLQYYNQETLLGGAALKYSGYPRFNGPQEFGTYMVSKGFNLVSTATNHSLDKGEQGVNASHDFWASQNGVLVQGLNVSQEEYDAIASTEVNGIKVAFLSYTEHTNGLKSPHSYSVNIFKGHEQEMIDKVKRAKEQNDLVIVALHWGTEYSNKVNSMQTDLADKLTKAGADVIVGNHAHVVQPFQWVNGRPVFYAMGNLIGSQVGVDRTTGMIAGMDVTKTKKEDGTYEIAVENVRAELIYTYMEGKYPALRTNIKVYRYKDLTDEILPKHDEYYKQFTDIITSLDKNISFGM